MLYEQEIKVIEGVKHLKIMHEGKILYEGEAYNTEDDGYLLTFIDNKGKSRKIYHGLKRVSI